VLSLERSGWTLPISHKALSFVATLVGFDASSILDEPDIAREIKAEIKEVMNSVKSSYAFSAIL
jgi:hypothetical protein